MLKGQNCPPLSWSLFQSVAVRAITYVYTCDPYSGFLTLRAVEYLDSYVPKQRIVQKRYLFEFGR
jgi:hypothetical protein